ncbi:MAG: DUF3078 domain-containing protein [Mariniphaga sp.]
MMIRNTLISFFCVVFWLVSTDLVAETRNFQNPSEAQKPRKQVADSLKWSVDYINKLLFSHGEWYVTDNLYKKQIQGVLNYAENDPLDTVVIRVNQLLNDRNVISIMDRRPQDIRNPSGVPGYVSEQEESKGVEMIKRKVLDSLNISRITVPTMIMESELSKAPVVPDVNPNQYLGRKKKDLPLEFVTNLDLKLAALQIPPNWTGAALDSARQQIFIRYRSAYNDSVLTNWRERITFVYRTQFIADQTDIKINNFKKSIQDQNRLTLTTYNDKLVSTVNDSLKIALKYLVLHAEADSSLIKLVNIADEKTSYWTANRDIKPIRMFLKNAQKDSLSVILINNGKGELKLVIDDGVKLTRFTESQNRSILFEQKAPDKKLKKVELKKIVYPAWSLFGNGSIGFTQTSLSNWAKGGESSLALLLMSKYNANYSKDKVKWENSAEFRYGISQTKTRGLEKNDDKFELQSRLGYSAFKKWFYSGEANFRTQLAPGYTFPDKDHPISAFMAPGYLTMSIGMDYKPNKDFSLFLAPFTSKTTFVRDTVMIAPSKFGLEPGKKQLWEPGIIVKANWHRAITENITYDTKGEFFNNYRYTFQKFAFEWEQVVIMRVSRLINARVMTQMVYDYNTKFPVLDVLGKEIGRKPKLQFKELFTIGLTYKF